ncbi:MAG: endo-1,4-beta-xylanase [Rhizomicrobium sp.]|jgi:endo-1,4-beta-xylanase
MQTRRRVLGVLPAAALLASSARAQLSLRPGILSEEPIGLRNHASNRGLVYGSATSTFQLRDLGFAGALAREAGLIVPEYEMKRGVLEPQPGRYDFSGCDSLLAFARGHSILMRGHPLVWHKRNPDWLEDVVRDRPDSDVLTGYISAVVRHFRGHIHSWDVVNEAIAPPDGRKDGLRETMWLKAFGPSYIDDAFHAAREADPSAVLVYNDWGCEAGAPDNDRFRAATLDFLNRALERGVPIDALGLQGHLAAFGIAVDQPKLARFLGDVKSLGLRVLVTELDVDDSNGPTDGAVRDNAVADATRRFLDVVLANSVTSAVLTWGLSDRFLDPPSWHQRLAGYSPRMLPLDSNLDRTPMWHAIARSFAGA